MNSSFCQVWIRLITALMLLVSGSGSAWAAAGSPWGANYFPNIELVTQDGKRVRFYDDLIKGKVVAINFVFTTCSQTCPAETAKLREVQRILGDRVGKDVFFYSISVDPHDTPEILKSYAKKFDVSPGWTFLTGKFEDITLLRTKLGMYRGSELEPDKADHATSLIVGNEATGQWVKRSPFDNAQVLAGVLGGWLHNWKVANSPGEQKRSYADATQINDLTHGQKLFQARCVACHSIGGGDSLGPDLLGVVDRRQKAWLTRWIMAPDRMIAEKDPLALALYAKYKELPMPNFGLSEHDAAALIDYMKSRSGPKELSLSSGNKKIESVK